MAKSSHSIKSGSKKNASSKNSKKSVEKKVDTPIRKKNTRRSRVPGDIKRLQKDDKLAFRRLPFARVVREIAQDFKEELRWEKAAIVELQVAAERLLVNFFATANFNLMAITKSKRITLQVDDLVTAVRGDTSISPIFNSWLSKFIEEIYIKNSKVSCLPKTVRVLDSKIENATIRINNKQKILDGIESGDATSISKARRYFNNIKKRASKENAAIVDGEHASEETITLTEIVEPEKVQSDVESETDILPDADKFVTPAAITPLIPINNKKRKGPNPKKLHFDSAKKVSFGIKKGDNMTNGADF